jgi:hypothetical protein
MKRGAQERHSVTALLSLVLSLVSTSKQQCFGPSACSLGLQRKPRRAAGIPCRMPIALRQKEESGGWDIVDGKRNEAVGKLAPEIEENLRKVISSVQDLFVNK